MKKKLKKIHFRPDFYYETVADFCYHLGIDAEDIASLTGLSVQTGRRYIRDNTSPYWLLPFLYAASGRLIVPGFDGWVFRDSTLAPPGFRFTLSATQIEQYRWHMNLLSEYSAKLSKGRWDDTRPTQGAEIIQLSRR